MNRFFPALAALSLGLTGCATMPGGLPSPASVADRTTIDEQAGITVTLAYTAAARAATLAIQTGLVRDPATIAQIKALDTRAYNAVLAMRAAYTAANSSGYASALVQANGAIGDFLAAVKGN